MGWGSACSPDSSAFLRGVEARLSAKGEEGLAERGEGQNYLGVQGTIRSSTRGVFLGSTAVV